jgi:hypothetical protein
MLASNSRPTLTIFSICLPITTDGWTTDDLVFQWKKENPVQVAKNMHLPRFILEKFQTDLCNSITNTGMLSLPNRVVHH